MKNISKTITFKEFNKRFRKDINNQGYIDNLTGSLIYCPHNLGFSLDQEDCLESNGCQSCWNEIKTYLEFRDREQ